MNADFLNELILETERERPQRRRDAQFSLKVRPSREQEGGHFELHFRSPGKGMVNLLLFNDSNVVCLQKERRCKPGLNVYRLNLTHYPEGDYRVGVLSEDQCATVEIVV
ncbi:MAG: hypothetical protein AAGN35_19690 [Bacteroidota bacterium]